MPTFGRDIIRKFSNDASSMKKLAARDFEDLLQCSIPVFEGLFPEPHDKIVLDLLFSLSTWHALAKLRIHTETSLGLLKNATQTLGIQLRNFKNRTCTAYQTQELPSETRKRQRKATQKGKAVATDSVATSSGLSADIHASGSLDNSQLPKLKELNLNTYKVHALGHYVDLIQQYGTTDSYSTQSVRISFRLFSTNYHTVYREN